MGRVALIAVMMVSLPSTPPAADRMTEHRHAQSLRVMALILVRTSGRPVLTRSGSSQVYIRHTLNISCRSSRSPHDPRIICSQPSRGPDHGRSNSRSVSNTTPRAVCSEVDSAVTGAGGRNVK